MSPSAPAWITAIATAALAGSVIVALCIGGRSVRRRARPLTGQRDLTADLAEAVALLSKDLRQSADERRRAQASQVFIELDRGAETKATEWRVRATVRNTSQQPVYDLYVIWLLGTTRAGKPDRAARLLPGREVCFERGPAPDGSDEPIDPGALAAFLTFRDTAGIRWTVREDGTFSDIPAPDPRSPHD